MVRGSRLLEEEDSTACILVEENQPEDPTIEVGDTEGLPHGHTNTIRAPKRSAARVVHCSSYVEWMAVLPSYQMKYVPRPQDRQAWEVYRGIQAHSVPPHDPNHLDRSVRHSMATTVGRNSEVEDPGTETLRAEGMQEDRDEKLRCSGDTGGRCLPLSV